MAEKKEDFYDIFKKIVRKTEDVIDGQIDNYITHTGDYVGKKIGQFQKGDIPGKVDDFMDKTEQKTREVSDKMAEKAEDIIDGFKARTGAKENQPPKEDTNQAKPIE
jgi:hypothetical protein